MKAISISFWGMLRQMKSDVMLVAIAVVPVLIGLLFRFAIPFAEKLLTGYFGLNEILTPYYGLFDIFLIILTPSMFNFVVAMVMLEEADDHITAYLSVTPLGKTGYLLSRLGYTGLIAFVVSIAIALIFHLTQMDILLILGVALAGTIQGVIVALLIVALSANKVEGMAVGKFTSLLSLGALVPYFVSGKAQYIVSVLPTFWIGKAMQTGLYYPLLISIFVALLWIVFLSGKLVRKIAG